jgi:hypothetical protein
MDPAWRKTGCGFNYELVDENELFSTLNFDDFMRDGFIFIWIVNALMDKIIKMMKRKGWKRIEWIVWNKYD